MEKRLGYSVLRNFDYSQPFAEGLVNRGRIEHQSSHILSKTCLDVFLPYSAHQTASLDGRISRNTFKDEKSSAASKSHVSDGSADLGGKDDVNHVNKSKDQTAKEGNLIENSNTRKHVENNSASSNCSTNDPTSVKDHDGMRNSTDHESTTNRNMMSGGRGRRPPPLVVFAYGGGWRRGDKQTWRHYISRWECNFSLAALVGCDRLYSNIGESFASRGIPCAVLSYPIAPTPGLLHLIEMSISLSYALAYNIFAALFLFFILKLLPENCFVGEGFTKVPFLSLTAGIILVAQWITLGIMFSREIYLDKQHKTDTKKRITRKMPIVIALIAILATVSMLDVYTLAENNTLTVTISGIFLFAVQCLIFYFRQTTSFELGPSLVTDPRGQAESVAMAVKWLVDYGRSTGHFDPDSIILMGHSAGGHLVSLVTLDHHYLTSVGISPQTIKGVITLSAVHDLQSISKGLFFYHVYLKPAFGTDPTYWTRMSPIQHVKILDENKDLSLLSNQSPSLLLPVSGSTTTSSIAASSSSSSPPSLSVSFPSSSSMAAASSSTSSSPEASSSSTSSSPPEPTTTSTSKPLVKSSSSSSAPSRTSSSSSSTPTPTSPCTHRPKFLILSPAQDFKFMIKDADQMHSILNKNGYITKRDFMKGCSHFNMVRKFGCPWYRFWTGVLEKNNGGGWIPSDGELLCLDFVQQFWNKE